MVVRAVPTQSILGTKGCFVCCANLAIPKPKVAIFNGNRSVSDCGKVD